MEPGIDKTDPFRELYSGQTPLKKQKEIWEKNGINNF
jgi:hypothetical protein